MIEQLTPSTLHVGAKYNWRDQPERLVYMGRKVYTGDRRFWFQFAKVSQPGEVWCEVLAEDLSNFEETKTPDRKDSHE